MFVVDGLIVPPSLRFEGQAYSNGWKLLRSVKSSEIDASVRDCGWNFVFMAELMKRTAFGMARGSSLRKAADKILSQTKESAFNAVEITGVRTRQFLGIHCATVAAHARSLQKGPQVRDISARRRELAMGMCIPGAERL
jgi:hypothetical protein